MTRNPAQTVVILPAERAVRIDGETRQIGARAFDVLAYLDAHSGRVVTKAELLENVWADLNVEESNLTVQIAALRKMIGARAIATVPGVGYRRIHVLLRREGWQVNIKKTRRIYNELGLQLRNKRPKRRVQAKLRDDCQEAVGPNDVWAMNFLFTTSWRLATSPVSSPSSTRIPASAPRPMHGSPIAARTLSRRWKASAVGSVIPGR